MAGIMGCESVPKQEGNPKVLGGLGVLGEKNGSVSRKGREERKEVVGGAGVTNWNFHGVERMA